VVVIWVVVAVAVVVIWVVVAVAVAVALSNNAARQDVQLESAVHLSV